MDGDTDGIIRLVYSKELKKNTTNATSFVTSPMKLFCRYISAGKFLFWRTMSIYKTIDFFIIITDGLSNRP
jgi:hypothetical protein